MNALESIDAAGPVRQTGFATPRLVFRSGSGKWLGEVPNGGSVADGTVSHTIRRADLYRALQYQARQRGITVEYGKKLVDARLHPDGVTALFADGSQALGDFLVGCDGLRSATRRIIDPAAPAARYVPVLNTGGYATGVEVDGQVGSST